MGNRRNAERKHTIYHSKVFNAQSGDLVGHMVDLSHTGIRIMAAEALDPGRTLDLKLELPRTVLGHETLMLQAEVKWCRPDINPEFFAIGFELIDTPEQISAILDTLQGALCFDH